MHSKTMIRGLLVLFVLLVGIGIIYHVKLALMIGHEELEFIESALNKDKGVLQKMGGEIKHISLSYLGKKSVSYPLALFEVNVKNDNTECRIRVVVEEMDGDRIYLKRWNVISCESR